MTNINNPINRIPVEAGAGFALPPKLEGLRRLAYNMYWSWHPRAQALFKRIDHKEWEKTRNPVAVLEAPVNFGELLDNPEFMAEYHSVLSDFDAYMNREDSWWQRSQLGDHMIAYFCAEFGLYESLNLYSGGLGILAGDHLKTASDTGTPFLGVGLFYRQGYFRQSIDADGHQEHAYPQLDPRSMPVRRVLDPRSGRPLLIEVPLPERTVHAGVWLAEVGTVPLLLLDTDIPENAASDRPITHQLYVRGRSMRLHQQVLLGVGGKRVLRALGLEAPTYHLNEGHSAIALVECMRELTETGVSFDDALQQVRAKTVFTIHTPVPAGNERYDANLLRHLVTPLLENSGMPVDRVLELGRGVDNDAGMFDMTAFCLRVARRANAVSQLHGKTANGTWNHVTSNEILGLTNGVHMPSWLGEPMQELYSSFGLNLDDLSAEGGRGRLWERMGEISDQQLWQAHQQQKTALSFFLRSRIRKQLARHGESPEDLSAVDHVLDPNVLTIGFARRFATYKRAALLFSDEGRLAHLLRNSERPVQIVFAGKAHPADRPGQQVIQEIFQRTRREPFLGKIFILEDYDIRIGRYLVQGVDIWLNNPRRPLEASGTSGMKAAANGVPNASILDGWWDEGYDGTNGWAIGEREGVADEGLQDSRDAESLYRTLEEQIIPLYYDRRGEFSPRWVSVMRHAIASSLWRFSTTRMVEDYVNRMYLER